MCIRDSRDIPSYETGIHGILFDKLIKNGYSLKEAVNEAAKEGLTSKNEAYKASLEIKNFLEKLKQGDQ